ncbi:tripartite tricarboxylate transporter TctB family protein [Acuticoccus sp. MNP-M23]|uniref:tripartite tricarboxylate transporter TctB family protein n=1 Tax=Acuticoccus sp. MNP-M23 TaxID=3072793 RepID=UPI002816604B|nr:tripartite tricarboxylate transporter TctB family protein [Acuticoccus sp. MNP-M23]WMS43728.1 tripartite tricarboxylate transporter TctB family protein [Acuticoccus sp. MNP-M23]
MSADPVSPAGTKPARADLFTGVLFLALGLAMLYGGYTMDRLTIRQIHPMSFPGMVPMALGAALAICALVLMQGAIRSGGLRAGFHFGHPSGLARLAIALGLCLAYPLVLIGLLPFWLATALFVTVFIAFFEWTARPPARHAIALATALLQGVLIGVVIAYVFSELFLVRLP